MDTAVSVKNITKKYKLYKDKWGPLKEIVTRKKLHDEFLALNDVSLDFPKGEAIGVLGKNGSGKSTLLKVITGIAEASDGTVSIDGSLVFLDVSSGIDPELSGYENIFMKGTLLGYTKEEMRAKVDDIIEFSELEDFIYQPVKNYSSGMKAKLGFAISINVDPDILIVDEALAVGDSMFREKCMDKMNQFKQEGKTIIFVSHDKHAVSSFCSKAAWINKGELITYGDSKYVSSLYDDFMSGRKKLETIRAEIEFRHAVEHVVHRVTDDGLTLQVEGYLYEPEKNSTEHSFEIFLRDGRTGEEFRKPLEKKAYQGDADLPESKKDQAGFTVEWKERDIPHFFKPGKFSLWVGYKNSQKEWVEFPLWAGQAKIEDKGSGVDNKAPYIYKTAVTGNQLVVSVDNRENVQEQVNNIWFENNHLHIKGVAFVRGYETETPGSVTMNLHAVSLDTFKTVTLPATVSKTEEITENPSFNPQGKNYNHSEFHAAFDLSLLEAGEYEFKLSYKMNQPPYYNILILVWASKHDAYPSEPIDIAGKRITIQTESKYLHATVE